MYPDMTCTTRAIICTLLLGSQLLASGCHTMASAYHWHRTKAPDPASNPSGVMPKSDRTYGEALKMAKSMTDSNATLWVGQVAATGSMCPYLGESSLVVLEPVNFDELKNKTGSLVAYSREGSLFIHVLVDTTPKGAVVRGASSNTLELVPYDSINGTATAVLYFDKKTAPTDRSGPPLLLAANPDDVPASSGTLRIIGASMFCGLPVTIFPVSPGRYKAIMHHTDAMQLTLGSPHNALIAPSLATITASEALVGQTVDFQIYDKDAPEIGHILLSASFEE
jgi:hypothetical protein